MNTRSDLYHILHKFALHQTLAYEHEETLSLLRSDHSVALERVREAAEERANAGQQAAETVK